ncbi:sulfotransferase [Pseudoalteromonas peptidolytica]|uniref:Sulfotransferase family protein n=1 Tax=Pseudoalteromonas peptidolytica F12-50-A1 TaxID=1315280 RepID=A0A8I0T5N9_9GAMM|nr:sulfotransferase [Pseudoalteromonas peptidolytica]MBE0346399.1 hypothetical protein [Pseudoalteromonas peptidolytica F12-50-A1]NLR14656.1 hypothetical protein [Pseudoalteromonas peptidolytica]GEK08967.1 hypothetical protein PPE03_12160 [Pseudoalteromonas peptidolytica]
MATQKILVTGLPRTGTTSLCITALNLGYKTAHTAYTRQAIKDANFLADTPVFADFEKLYTLYPSSKIIHLTREFEQWLPSIRRLMSSMRANLLSQQGGFNDTIKRCYLATFPNFEQHFEDDDYWLTCYNQHTRKVRHFVASNQIENIEVMLTDADITTKLAQFMDCPGQNIRIPHVNINGKVTAWKWFQHSNKIDSTRNGKSDKDATLYNNAI